MLEDWRIEKLYTYSSAETVTHPSRVAECEGCFLVILFYSIDLF